MSSTSIDASVSNFAACAEASAWLGRSFVAMLSDIFAFARAAFFSASLSFSSDTTHLPFILAGPYRWRIVTAAPPGAGLRMTCGTKAWTVRVFQQK